MRSRLATTASGSERVRPTDAKKVLEIADARPYLQGLPCRRQSRRMPNGLRIILDRLRQAIPPGEHTDGQLLARFVAARDEAAFSALLRRHGPLVLSVCRRLARHEQDAE